MQDKNHDKSAEIEQFINNFSDTYGYSPTMDEISAGTGYPKTTVFRHIAQLREKGVINYSGHRRIASTKEKKQMIRVPVLGAVACGIPKFAEENIEEYIKLPVSLFGEGDYFILRAYGDSMIDAGIFNDDLVLVKRCSDAESGQIVVALVDNDEATLKRYFPEPKRHRVRLHPENSSMDDIIVDSCIIQGVAVKVIKDIS
ncbi:MAG: repressor LexA [Clostridia bacterium]|nr:repressor LexA [Clostridia bacterium]